MSDWQETPGHWQASDDKWYPPETHPDYRPPTPPQPPVPPPPAGGFEAPAYPAHPQYPPSPPTYTAPAPLAARSTAAPPAPPSASSAWYQQPWVLLLGALLSIAGLIGYFGSRGGDDTAASDAGTSSPSSPAATAQDERDDVGIASEPAGSAGSAGSAALAAGASACTYLGVDSFQDMQVRLEFTHDGPASDIFVTYGMFDPDQVRIATTTELIQLAQPGESFRVDDDTLENVPSGLDPSSAITCEILGIEPFDLEREPTLPGPDDRCRVTEVDSFGDIQVEVTVTNPFGEIRDVFVPLALRSDELRFGGSTAFLDLVGPDETVRKSTDTLTDLPDGLDLRDVQCEILEIESFG